MPKRKGGRKDTLVFPFHTIILTNTGGTGANGFTVSPNATLTPRGLIEADTWAHFKVTKLRFRLHPTDIAIDSDVAVGYVGGVQDSNPSTIAQVGELIPSVLLGGQATVPSEWVSVSAQELSGPFPWYKTIPGAADPTEEAPGSIVVTSTTISAGFSLELRGEIVFKTAVAAANTPSAVRARELARTEKIRAAAAAERDILLRILSTTESASVAGAKTVLRP